MTLEDYLAKHEMSASEFARLIGVAPETVRRYCERDRIPRKDEMQRIFEATAGEVTPNDFFDLSGAAHSGSTPDPNGEAA